MVLGLSFGGALGTMNSLSGLVDTNYRAHVYDFGNFVPTIYSSILCQIIHFSLLASGMAKITDVKILVKPGI